MTNLLKHYINLNFEMLPIEKYNNIVKMKWSPCQERDKEKSESLSRIRTHDLPNTGQVLYPLDLQKNSFYNIIASFVPDRRHFH